MTRTPAEPTPEVSRSTRRLLVIGFCVLLGILLATVALIFGWAQDPPARISDPTARPTVTASP